MLVRAVNQPLVYLGKDHNDFVLLFVWDSIVEDDILV